MPSVVDEREYSEGTFMCVYDVPDSNVWFMHMRITFVLVNLVFRLVECFK